MFRSAFLKRVPLFVRNLSENVVLCLLAACIESTSKRVLETVVLDWRNILTSRIHKLYFDNMVSGRLRPQRNVQSSYKPLFGTSTYTVEGGGGRCML